MSPRISIGPEPVLAAHVQELSAAAFGCAEELKRKTDLLSRQLNGDQVLRCCKMFQHMRLDIARFSMPTSKIYY
jgi:hypothetical protein